MSYFSLPDSSQLSRFITETALQMLALLGWLGVCAPVSEADASTTGSSAVGSSSKRGILAAFSTVLAVEWVNAAAPSRLGGSGENLVALCKVMGIVGGIDLVRARALAFLASKRLHNFERY